MDSSQIGVYHRVALEDVRFIHIVDVSPAVASIARDLRYAIIAAVLGFSTVAVTREYLRSRDRRSRR